MLHKLTMYGFEQQVDSMIHRIENNQYGTMNRYNQPKILYGSIIVYSYMSSGIMMSSVNCWSKFISPGKFQYFHT